MVELGLKLSFHSVAEVGTGYEDMERTKTEWRVHALASVCLAGNSAGTAHSANGSWEAVVGLE